MRARLRAHRLSLSVALAVLLIAVASLMTVASSPGDPRKAVRVSPAQARDAVARLAPGDSGLIVDGPKSGSANAFFIVRSQRVQATVDAYTGTVLTFFDSTLIPASGGVAISPQQAQSIAAGFLTQNGITVDGLSPSVELVDHGDFEQYTVTWSGMVGGVRTPALRQVSIDASSGRAFGFADFDRPYTSPPAPILSATDAEQAARLAIGDPAASASMTDMAITFDPNGKQILVYEVHLTTADGFMALVQVDALTGATEIMGRG